MSKIIYWSKHVQLDIRIIKKLEGKWDVQFPKEYVELEEKSLEEWQDETLFFVSVSFEEFLNSIQPSKID